MMPFMPLMRIRRLDLQAKISLVLVAVILPTFLIVTVLQHQLAQVVLQQEIRQVGLASAKTLASEIVRQRYLLRPDPQKAIEAHLQEYLYAQPNILKMDVIAKDPATGRPIRVASNIEEEPGALQSDLLLVEKETSIFRFDEELGLGMWEIHVPIERKSRAPNGGKRNLGTVHALVSTSVLNQIEGPLWRTSATAAALSVFVLVLVLSYFLRKTIANDRKLRRAEDQNLELTQQLHDAHRQLMNTEKLAVMGQLTASFAHEIGTPLNAIGGHLQLLQEEVESVAPARERLGIIEGQVKKIERIVRDFLQSTAKPASQRQLVDLNRLADQTVNLVRPRAEAMEVTVRRNLDRSIGPLRAVPIDLEQVLLNLVNNSLDSIQSSAEKNDHRRRLLEIRTGLQNKNSKDWAVVTVYDTGEGIPKGDLKKVLKPFFTTKRPGQGTGLGLTICQQLVQKYGGVLDIDSREGAWTRISVRIPYEESR